MSIKSISYTPRPLIVIATPALADANNGNWRTAHRWQQLLEPHCRVILAPVLGDSTDLLLQTRLQTAVPDLFVALHARRSHASIVQMRRAHPQVPIVLALTGTDLYADLNHNRDANESLDLADALIVLQEDAIQYVPSGQRRKTHVVFQSARSLAPAVKSGERINCVVVGHLRAEKSPQTIFEAVALLNGDDRIHITHIGAPHSAADEALARQAQALSETNSHYHWVGGLAHGLTRAAIKRSHLLVHPSVLEGGANVIVEAITAGTPVVASRMSGNVGMLGVDYAGYFPVGDAAAIVTLLRRCLTDANFMLRLNTACKVRAALFSPNEEQRRLLKIVSGLLEGR